LMASKVGPQLRLSDENDEGRAVLAVIKNNPFLNLNDAVGNPVWSAP
ncbi:MAG: hypothetical protein FJ088_06865, partial [Deltaproteobacteria bacterium]|nr:hypothetical protein [Deltaproteobacteria bacterium]